jgi:hypothetical protein
MRAILVLADYSALSAFGLHRILTLLFIPYPYFRASEAGRSRRQGSTPVSTG